MHDERLDSVGDFIDAFQVLVRAVLEATLLQRAKQIDPFFRSFALLQQFVKLPAGIFPAAHQANERDNQRGRHENKVAQAIDEQLELQYRDVAQKIPA